MPGGIAGEDVGDASAGADSTGELVIALLFVGAGLSMIVVFVATVVAYLMWIHRAYANLTALGNPKESLEYSPGWAVGGFFIPFANLVVPYRVVREIWTKSDPSIRSEQDFMFSGPQTAGIIGLWWAFWLISNVANNIFYRFAGEARTPEDFLLEGHISLGIAVLDIIAAVLAIKVVRGIDRRQEERSKHVSFAYAAPPLPTSYAATDPRP
jgi:hypothetical protein